MKLLFGKVASAFGSEFKTVLGFVDADLPFDRMQPDLRTATKTILDIIGTATYAEIVSTYEAALVDYTTSEGQILQAAQYAVATLAFRLFAPSNDLQYGKNGRKMLTSEESKTPFEHMLVASNDELDRRSFRAMDTFIDLLDESSATWKASTNYKSSHRLFVRTTAEFDQFYVIGSRYLLLKLSPGLALAEKRLILPRMAELYALLKAKREGTSTVPLTDSESSLLSLINEACVYSALAWGVIRLQATLFPEGLLQSVRGERTTIKGRMPFLGNQVDQLAHKFSEDAERTLLEIEAAVYVPEVIVDDTGCPPEDIHGFSLDDKFVT